MSRRQLEFYIQAYLRGEHSLLDLRRALVALLATDRAGIPEDVLQLAWGVELCIADFSAHAMTQREFEDALRNEAGLNPAVIVASDGPLELTSATPTKRQSAEFASATLH